MKTRNCSATFKLSVVLIIVLAIAGGLFTSYMVRYGEGHERRNLTTLAVTASATIDPVLVEALAGQPDDVKSMTWGHIRGLLRRIHEVTPDSRFVYVMALRGEKLVFLADAEPEDSSDYSPPGQAYDEASPAMMAMFYNARPMVEGPVEDKWGTWISGLAPIVDPRTNKVVGIMGIDIDARHWKQIVGGYRMIGISISSLVVVGAILFSIMLYMQRRASLAISDLNDKLTTELDERKRVQEALLLLEKAVHTTKVGIVFRDCDNIVRYINPADAEMHGYKAEDIVGKDVSVLGVPTNQKRLTKEELKQIKTWERERINVRRDGSTFPVHLISDVVLNEHGEPLGIVTTCEDITARKRAEEELQEAKEAAEAASKSKSEFLANMSHELRTPLNGIIGLTELALDGGGLDEIETEHMQMVAESARMLLHIINDILDFSKIEAGKLELELAPFDLMHMLRSVVEPLGVVARKKGLNVELNVGEDIPRFLIGDAGRLRQMLFNLLGNAVKFTDAGLCSVSVTMAPMTDRAELDEDECDVKVALKFAVRDTGIGIPPEKQEMIFGKFSQADQTVTRRFGGTGLGLAISRSLAGLMSGDIWVESQPGMGSTFYFNATLGIAGEEVVPQAPLTHCAMPGKPDDSTPLRVLLAEDNKINQIVACSFLERDGHSVRIAHNGAQALEALVEEPFDLVFMDVEMPVMDGIEATRIIRSDEKYNSAIPIIALTAHAIAGYKEKLLAAGMDYYISKPVVLADIRAGIGKVMAGRMTISEMGIGFAAIKPQARGDSVLDLAAMSARLMNDKPLMDEMLALFESEAPARFSSLGEALEIRDEQQARVAAHSFKNLALNVGADRLSALLLKIELLCAEADVDRAADEFEGVSEELASVTSAIQNRDAC